MNNDIPTYTTIIIGAGQAGLATSYYLKAQGVNHLILEKDTVASSWKNQRWDSFTMNTPNWMTSLPGMDINEAVRERFMTGAEFVNYLQKYVDEFQLPIQEKVKVTSVKKLSDNYLIEGFLDGSENYWYAKNVVIASGCINKPQLPKLSESITQSVLQLHSAHYKNPQQLPAGSVLIVGGGQTGCQLAEELILAGKKVYMAGSKVPRAPRRYKGRDIMEWQNITGAMDTPAEKLAENPELDITQPQVSGLGEYGHTVSYQSLHGLGVTVLGTFLGSDKSSLLFSDNAADFIRFADKTSTLLKQKVDSFLERHPEIKTLNDVDDVFDNYDIDCVSDSRITSLNINEDNISTIIWCTGFGYDFSYLVSSLLDDKGKPKHTEGIMEMKGLYCVGFPWLRKKKSGLVYGVREDAKVIADNIFSRMASPATK